MIRIFGIVMLALLALPAAAKPLANQLFGAADAPSQQPPMPIGSSLPCALRPTWHWRNRAR